MPPISHTHPRGAGLPPLPTRAGSVAADPNKPSPPLLPSPHLGAPRWFQHCPLPKRLFFQQRGEPGPLSRCPPLALCQLMALDPCPRPQELSLSLSVFPGGGSRCQARRRVLGVCPGDAPLRLVSSQVPAARGGAAAAEVSGRPFEKAGDHPGCGGADRLGRSLLKGADLYGETLLDSGGAPAGTSTFRWGLWGVHGWSCVRTLAGCSCGTILSPLSPVRTARNVGELCCEAFQSGIYVQVLLLFSTKIVLGPPLWPTDPGLPSAYGPQSGGTKRLPLC